jgi:hypothetical protein
LADTVVPRLPLTAVPPFDGDGDEVLTSRAQIEPWMRRDKVRRDTLHLGRPAG